MQLIKVVLVISLLCFSFGAECRIDAKTKAKIALTKAKLKHQRKSNINHKIIISKSRSSQGGCNTNIASITANGQGSNRFREANLTVAAKDIIVYCGR